MHSPTRLVRVLVRVDDGPTIEIGHQHIPEHVPDWTYALIAVLRAVTDRVAMRRQLAETLEGPA